MKSPKNLFEAMRHFLFRAFTLIVFLSLGASHAPRSSAQVGEPWQLIAEVNALRASYGLPAYEVDNALMAAAQSHSEYQASIGTWTHSGPGGSRPHDRAVAAGYGGGAQVYVSENVATGVDLSPSTTVYQMWQDAVHLDTMISPNYRHIGAGVAEGDGWVYYTIDVGYIAGNPGEGPQPSAVPTLPGGTPAPTAIALVPITVATPRSDGAIIHVVQYGQFLENIAKAYDISLQELLEQNYLNQNTVIFPGDKLLIKPSTTPNGSATDNPTPAQASSSTSDGAPTSISTAQPKRPTPTPSPATVTPIALAAAVEPIDPGDTAPGGALVQSAEETHVGPDYLLIIVFVLAVVGGGLIALGTAVKRAA
jgi:LysM repeat protein